MRLLLDTNVWSRLIDRGAGEDFYRYARTDQIEVVIPPATLLELLRTPDKSNRRKQGPLRLPIAVDSTSDRSRVGGR